jgi:hypothetical protein
VKLAKWSFKVNHSGPFHIVKQQVNPMTWFAVFVARGGVTLSAGTGAYKAISGSGTATITDIAIANQVANEETIPATAHLKV